MCCVHTEEKTEVQSSVTFKFHIQYAAELEFRPQSQCCIGVHTWCSWDLEPACLIPELMILITLCLPKLLLPQNMVTAYLKNYVHTYISSITFSYQTISFQTICFQLKLKQFLASRDLILLGSVSLHMWSLPGFPQPEQMGTKLLVSACLPCPPGSISLMAEDLYPNAIG